MPVGLAVVALLAILGRADADVEVGNDVDNEVGACKHPAPVEKFGASFYTALIVDHDPNIVDTLSVTGEEAGMLMYHVTKSALEKFRQCNADEVAFIAGRALAHFDNLTLPYYFKQEAYTVGNILYQFGVLNCTNAVPLSLEYLTYGRKEFKDLDPHKFDSYMHEIVYAGIELYAAHNLNLKTVILPTADVFKQLFTENKKANPYCRPSNATM